MKASLQWRAATLQRELVDHLYQTALAENWGLACLFAGWVHLAVFAACYYVSEVRDRHTGGPYLALWIGEAASIGLAFWLGARGTRSEPSPLAEIVKRIWIAFLFLAANTLVLNHALGFRRFVFLPVLASLGSFAFLMLIVLVSWRFLGALLLMCASGWAMARMPGDAYLIYGAAWWIILERTGMVLCLGRLRQGKPPRPAGPSPALSDFSRAEI